jgi:hypothetical protein
VQAADQKTSISQPRINIVQVEKTSQIIMPCF